MMASFLDKDGLAENRMEWGKANIQLELPKLLEKNYGKIRSIFRSKKP
jgi:hypothetical protein